LPLLSTSDATGGAHLQIVLAGQPEIDQKLAHPAAEPAREKLRVRVTLRPLLPTEVEEYIRARLARAGAADAYVFSTQAFERIATLSEGVPRVINGICDAALQRAGAAGTPVTADIVDRVWL